MKDEIKGFGLASREDGDPAPVLTGVQANGRLDGVLFNLTLRQSYRNTSSRVLEVVYTFPLPQQAVLLGFASELNGERKVGTIVARREAERQYEAALAEGDAPVMLEALADGLHTANIGNLRPGDEMTLEVQFAQLLMFEQGRLRLAIPATIAPRYGHAESAGLQPQQVPQATLTAEYPLALSITVAGSLAAGTVECPTHRFTREVVDGGFRLDLAAGAWLDRDVVIVVTPREPWPSLVIQAPDSVPQAAPVVVMAALQPPMTAPRQRILLKLLVDCSGSMGGDSIASARVALHGALAGLTEQDWVSVSRFGSTVDHVLAPSACTPHTVRHLKHAVDAIDADLGGTEMEAALRAVFELRVAHCGKNAKDVKGATGTKDVQEFGAADVLLVTDGEIWQAEEVVTAARASGHRVFAIGVGSSPAEGVLRALAEATGGACEFATPGEALEAAAARMLVRIRQQPWRGARIEWGFEPVWQTTLSGSVFGGDTVMAFAAMNPSPTVRAETPVVRLLAVDVSGTATEVARGEADAPCPGDSLPRIAAARRIALAGGPEALTLAIDYQLMSPQTHCVLVHHRADADKATEEAELHRVGSMLAAGWGATSTVMESASMGYVALSAPSVVRSLGQSVDSEVQYCLASAQSFEVPAFLRQHSEAGQPASIQAMVAAVFDHLSRGGRVHGLALHCGALDLHADARVALEQAAGLGLSPDEAWLVLAHWANKRPGGMADTALAAALQPQLDGIDAKLVAQCVKLFNRTLGNPASDSWTLSRRGRLQRALTRTSP